MKSILVISEEKEVFHAIRACFDAGFRIGHVPNQKVSLELLRKTR